MSFFTIELLRRALVAQQRAMDVTGHNIANVNTPGFSRQEAIFATTPPSGGSSRQGTTLILGTGVDVPVVRQARDLFIDRQVRQQQQTLAEWQVRQDVFSQIEAVFPEPSAVGLSVLLGRFWSAWHELSLAPESTAARAAVVQQAQTLAASFQQAYRQLDDVRNQLDVVAVGRIERVNRLAGEIASLNVQVGRFEVAGQPANDLRDRREALHAELATLADVSAVEAQNGELLVYVQGRQLVGPAGLIQTIQITPGGPGAPSTFQWADGGALSVSRGDLAATLAARDIEVPALQARLNAIAAGLITAVNTVHSAGFTLQVPPGAGGVFFTGADATDIAVRSDVASDVRNVAASGTGEAGDGNVALQLAQLRTARVLDGGTATVDDAYAGLVSGIGVKSQEAGRQVGNQQLLLDQLLQRRESISGVSIDEEMTNMIKFQRAYEAAARMVTTVDEMIQTVLDMVGR